MEKIMPLLNTLSSQHGVGPICQELAIAPSTYYWHQQRHKNPLKRSKRDHNDEQLKPAIQRVYADNYSVYGYRKVWHQLKREGVSVARCTIERLMKALTLQGVRRGKGIKTTRRHPAMPTPLDRVQRQFVAQRPNQLWVADFT
jgi:putative transposase